MKSMVMKAIGVKESDRGDSSSLLSMSNLKKIIESLAGKDKRE